MCAIERRDCGEWALPGGMVDPGENVSVTLRREFAEEALNTNTSSEQLKAFFAAGHEIYKGYVDDPRNTDNAWMETVAVNFHDDTGEFVGNLNLTAGDDAAKVKWMDLDHDLGLYASHLWIVEQMVRHLKAHW
jgi:ADP-ribose pyrophosphatase